MINALPLRRKVYLSISGSGVVALKTDMRPNKQASLGATHSDAQKRIGRKSGWNTEHTAARPLLRHEQPPVPTLHVATFAVSILPYPDPVTEPFHPSPATLAVSSLS